MPGAVGLLVLRVGLDVAGGVLVFAAAWLLRLHAKQLVRVRKIVLDGLRGHQVRVYLFGSAAQGLAGPGSDIDVAVLPLKPLPFPNVSRGG